MLPEDALERDGIGGKPGDTLAQLLNSHGLLVEVEAEESLVINVRFLLDIQRSGVLSIKLLRDIGGRIVKFFEKFGLRANTLAKISLLELVAKRRTAIVR